MRLIDSTADRSRTRAKVLKALCWRTLVALASLVAFTLAWAGPAAALPVLGSQYTGRAKPIPTKPATAPPPAVISANGEHPDVIVDEAGTAHIVWNEHTDGAPDVTVYCRVPRGAKACDVMHRLIPPGANELSQDADGPQVTALNDSVTIVSHRFPQEIAKPGPDRSNDRNTLYFWVSNDGGQTFPDPGIVGTTTAGGDAKAFGKSVDNPFLGVVTNVETGGVSFTGIAGGTFQASSALLAPDGLHGRLAVLNGLPSVAYHDTSNTAFIRSWTGQGDVNDPGTWSPPVSFPGFDTGLTVAADRLLALDKKPDGSSDLELRDVAAGTSRVIGTGVDIGPDAIPMGHPDGTVSAIWRGHDKDLTRGVFLRDRMPGAGSILGTPNLVTTADGLFLSADATDDGGGFLLQDTVDKKILLSGFGNTLPTGKPGLGKRDGAGALPADVAVACGKLQVGGLQALVKDGVGCFLDAARKPGVKVSTVPFLLNGLEIVPDPGVQVQLDLRAKTLTSTGTVSVLLNSTVLPTPITIFRGILSLDAAGKSAGESLGKFGASDYVPDLLGFKLPEVNMTLAPPDGVRIKVSVELPKEFGNVRGSAVLIADNKQGFHFDSLDISADDVPIGGATMKRLRIQYRATGGTSAGDCLRTPPYQPTSTEPNEWAGVFEIKIPPPKTGPTVCGSIRFGPPVPPLLREASFRIDQPFPGFPLFPGVGLTSLGGDLKLSPKPVTVRLDGTIEVGLVPSDEASIVQANGTLIATFGDPFSLSADADWALFHVPFGKGHALITSDGYFNLSLSEGFEFGPFEFRNTLNGFIDAPRKEFTFEGDGRGCIKGICVARIRAIVSTKGFAACVFPAPPWYSPTPNGVLYRTGDTLPKPTFGTCDDTTFATFRTNDIRAAALPQPAAEVSGAIVDRGDASLRVTGDVGVPDIDMIGPNGQPVPFEARTLPGDPVLYVGIRNPSPGTYVVRAKPGTPLIADVEISQTHTPAKVSSIKVSGKGATRTLAYTAAIAPDQGVTLVERGAGRSHVIGTATTGSQRLRFTPAQGPGGRREIVALLAQDGIVRHEDVVGSYVAPPPPAVGRATRLRLRRLGAGVVVTWRPGSAAEAQQLVVKGTNGLLVARVLGAGVGKAVIPDVDGRKVTVTLRGVGSTGTAGPVARASLAAAPPKPRKPSAARRGR